MPTCHTSCSRWWGSPRWWAGQMCGWQDRDLFESDRSRSVPNQNEDEPQLQLVHVCETRWRAEERAPRPEGCASVVCSIANLMMSFLMTSFESFKKQFSPAHLHRTQMLLWRWCLFSELGISVSGKPTVMASSSGRWETSFEGEELLNVDLCSAGRYLSFVCPLCCILSFASSFRHVLLAVKCFQRCVSEF